MHKIIPVEQQISVLKLSSTVHAAEDKSFLQLWIYVYLLQGYWHKMWSQYYYLNISHKNFVEFKECITEKKKVCFTLHFNMNYSDSKIPFCVSQDILIGNHILIYSKVLKPTYFNIQQNNKRAYTSVHMAARTIWLQAVQYLVFQLLYTAHLVDINAHIQNATTNKTIITLNQLRNQERSVKVSNKEVCTRKEFYILQLKGNKIL